jgi:hypothetical protein
MAKGRHRQPSPQIKPPHGRVSYFENSEAASLCPLLLKTLRCSQRQRHDSGKNSWCSLSGTRTRPFSCRSPNSIALIPISNCCNLRAPLIKGRDAQPAKFYPVAGRFQGERQRSSAESRENGKRDGGTLSPNFGLIHRNHLCDC